MWSSLLAPHSSLLTYTHIHTWLSSHFYPLPNCYLRHAPLLHDLFSSYLASSCQSVSQSFASTKTDMDKSKAEGKREYREEDGEEDEDDDFTDLGFLEDERKRRVIVTEQLIQSKKGGSRSGGGCSAPRPTCQVDYCNTDLADAKHYHKRHKVCESHAKAPSVSIAGLQQRFCQQCSRFHDLPEFDDNKRSCRRRLAGHNERRRKNLTSEYHGDGQG